MSPATPALQVYSLLLSHQEAHTHIYTYVAQWVKNPLAVREMQVRSLSGEDPLEEDIATLSSILAWSIPWTEEPDRLQSIG